MEIDNQKSRRSVIALGIAIILVQVVDIVIHVLADQIELIRILSNIIIVVWVLQNLFSSTPGNRLLGFGVLSLYLVLNIIFLFLEGLLNVNGDPRVMFYILIGLTTLLSLLFIRRTS